MLPMLVSPAQLVQLYGGPFVRAANYCPYINEAMHEFGIITPPRAAAFLAQIGHESGRLQHTREIWGPTEAQRTYERDFGAPWPATAAEARQPAFRRNRKAFELGNTEPGDGRRYLGRGFIQTTGRSNVAEAAGAFGEDFITYPALLETPKWAAMSAGLFWSKRSLNDLADAGEFDQITRRINGGQTGRAERVALYERARALIS